MLFNSFEYLVFLPVVFVLYWVVFNYKIKTQNLLLLITSYIFYGWWDWRFLSLIIFSSFIDYVCGLSIYKATNLRIKKRWLTISIVVNLGFLGVFKYFNFFSQSFTQLFQSMGYELDAITLNVILPVGISFYTFQTMSYTIDIYNGKLKPSKDLVAFFAFVSFFPQLVAGPIERATNLLPQFYKKRTFDYNKAVDGLQQILWGLFKKVVIADNCAEYVNYIFENSSEQSGSTLYFGAILFAFQIYGDFSGYSDIAIGTARLFGFELMKNFNFPYFSRDIAEFWRRWHISLSTWFRDYVYIPLGGSKVNTGLQIRNVFIIFLVSGFWHGANWTYIIWGALHALYFLPLLLMKKNRKNIDAMIASGRILPSLSDFFKIVFTFNITIIAWVFFRASDVWQAFQYLNKLFSLSFFSIPKGISKQIIVLIVVFILIEWLGRGGVYGISNVRKWNRFPKYLFYYLLVVAIFWYGGKDQQFIYFQF